MPVTICPRCKHVNPQFANYCHFDGVVLQAHQDAAAHRLPNEFVFPSGRRCKTFDEFAQGCQEEWAAARDLLMHGMFTQYFRAGNRADLVRAADDAKAQTNPDIALTTFLISLPGTRTHSPKLDLTPRRILLGSLLVGETKTVPLTVINQGPGMLQGTITVAEGQDWLSLSDTKPVHEAEVSTMREQTVRLTIKTKGIAAGQTYGAKLTVVTNGGIVEVPLRMDLAAQPFAQPPFQGVRTQRDFAEKMRLQPKAAVPILESGEAQRWFEQNGWTYPVSGKQVKGVGGVQQFFEGMGLSKPPDVQLSQKEFRFTCKHQDTLRGQVTLSTDVKKWVYADIKSDCLWLKTPMPQVSGAQQAVVPIEIDTTQWTGGPIGEGRLTLTANGGQKFTVKVTVEVIGAPAEKATPSTIMSAPTIASKPAPSSAIKAGEPPPVIAPTVAHLPADRARFMPAFLTMVLLCFMVRMALVPIVDWYGRDTVTIAAITKLGVQPTVDSPFGEIGGWLNLPWLPILTGVDDKLSANTFQNGNNAELSMSEFRHYFASYFIRWFVLRLWWVGAVFGVLLVLRGGGGMLDAPWGVIAGAGAGFAIAATLAAIFLIVEMIPHTLWHLTLGQRGGFGLLLLWSVLAVLCWLGVGVVLGIVVPWFTLLRRVVINPIQGLIAGSLGLVGLRRFADYWTPSV
ncbi:MAG: hypothetical protein EXS16_09160 [Gemmataceae bacterium]|nr:hypothetical protein [Gemmataceae bacterium]